MSIRHCVLTALLVPLTVTAAEEKLKAPAVTVQAVSRIAGGVESGDSATVAIPMTLVVTNDSERELVRPALVLAPNADFAMSELTPPLPDAIAPFQTFAAAFELRPRRRIAYGKHDVVLAVRYRWSEGTKQFTSARPVVASVTVKRFLEDEAKGLPGGTGALFYLLLPVLPAFFAYQFVDRLRRGEGVQIPVFGSEYLLPGFVIGLMVNFVAGARTSRWGVLVAAALIGAVWPAARWAWESHQWKLWAFRENDGEQEYLHKALLSPWVRRRDHWGTGKSGSETWGGMCLEQPDGRRVLGARLVVSPKEPADNARVEALVVAAVGNAAPRAARQQLVQAVKDGTALVSRLENVDRGASKLPEIVAAETLLEFKQETVKVTPLLEYKS